MAIKTKTVYVTDDGVEHGSAVMAKQHELFQELLKTYSSNGFESTFTSDQVVNSLYDNRKLILAYIDATEAMIKASTQD